MHDSKKNILPIFCWSFIIAFLAHHSLISNGASRKLLWKSKVKDPWQTNTPAKLPAGFCFLRTHTSMCDSLLLNLLERVIHLLVLHKAFPVITHFSGLTESTLYCEFQPDIHYETKNLYSSFFLGKCTVRFIHTRTRMQQLTKETVLSKSSLINLCQRGFPDKQNG